MLDCVVREAAEADQRAILDIYNDAVLHSTATFDLEPRTWEEHQRWLEEHRPPYQVLVATVGDTVAAGVAYRHFAPSLAIGSRRRTRSTFTRTSAAGASALRSSIC